MFFLSTYTFIILTMRYVHRVKAGQSELNEARVTLEHTNTVPSRDLPKFIDTHAHKNMHDMNRH